MKLVILVAALAVQAGAAPAPSHPDTREPQRPTMTLPSSPEMDRLFATPNLASQPPGCRTIIQQVQAEALRNRDNEYRTLDREPPASLLLAVDRHVGGCREPTFVRRNIGSNEREPAAR